MGHNNDMYERLKDLYIDGELTQQGLSRAVLKDWITEKEMQEIIEAGTEA